MEMENIEQELKSLYSDRNFKKLLEGGMSFAYDIDGKIIRIPKTDYAKNGYVTEKAILDYLKTKISSTQIPNITIVERPFFHTVHKKIEGIYWREKVYLAQDEKTRDALAEECAVFFSELHSSDVKKINAQLLEVHTIQHNLETYLCEYFNVDEMNKILKFTNPLYSLGDKVLVHRDFYYDNFLLSDDYKLNGVLDFGNSGIYNYLFDFKALACWESAMRDFFQRITDRYSRITGRIIDIETIRRIDIHNYISFLVYFTKNKDVKDEKINAAHHMDEHVAHVKEKLKMYVG